MSFQNVSHRINAGLALAGATLMFPAQSAAFDDAAATGAEAGKHAAEQAGNIFKLMKTAFQGGDGSAEAMSELMTHYAWPAVLALVFLIVGYMIASFIGRTMGSIVTKKVDVTLGKFLSKAIKNALMVLVVLGALGYFGVDVTSFAAILAALGFAIGMALQGTLSNFAAGMMLLVFRPFKVDDYIVVNGSEGTVEEIDLFTTRLNTPDNRHVILPNGQIFGNVIENFSHNEVRRVDVSVGADYGADLTATRSALETAIAAVRGQVNPQNGQVYLVDLGDSCVNWQCRVWCRPVDYWAVREELTETTKNALDNANIGIPFPQLDVNVVGKVLARAA